MIDATDVRFAHEGVRSRSFRILTLGELTPANILAAPLFDRQTRLSPEEIEACRQQWRRLKAANAPLRIVDGDRLVSAALDYFDADILSCATPDWQIAARVVGAAMGLWCSSPPPLHFVSDLLIWARVRALGEAGALEFDGDGVDMRGTRVRLPGSPT